MSTDYFLKIEGITGVSSDSNRQAPISHIGSSQQLNRYKYRPQYLWPVSFPNGLFHEKSAQSLRVPHLRQRNR